MRLLSHATFSFGANCRRSTSVSWSNPYCIVYALPVLSAKQEFLIFCASRYYIAATCVACDVGDGGDVAAQRFYYGHNDDVRTAADEGLHVTRHTSLVAGYQHRLPPIIQRRGQRSDGKRLQNNAVVYHGHADPCRNQRVCKHT
jgi:hypothetical protein